MIDYILQVLAVMGIVFTTLYLAHWTIYKMLRLLIKIKMESQNLEVGKIYDVVSQRKGKFKMQLTHQDETWASGVITEGKAKAIYSYNEVEKGEEVTVRKSLTTFTAVS